MENKIDRRKAIQSGLAVSLASLGGLAFSNYKEKTSFHTKAKEYPFRISLNTSTLMAYKLKADQQIDMVAAAGFGGIELWMRDIQDYLEQGGQVSGLKEKLEAGELVLENIIGFSQWCSDNAEERQKAREQLQREMEIVSALGGQYIAAPVMGIDQLDPARMPEYAERYHEILELEAQTGVIPILEIWGAGALHTLADCAQIAIATGHPKATMLLDFYHLFRGGTDWDSISLVNGARLPVIHMNDYPATPAREALTDAHRLLPGEGVCPYAEVLPALYKSGFRGGLSVELFNREYWASMDAATMLEKSYTSTARVIEKSMSSAL